MRARISAILLALSLLCFQANAQEVSRTAFGPVCESLRMLLQERTSVSTDLTLERILRRSSQLDFYFSVELGDYPWHEEVRQQSPSMRQVLMMRQRQT